MTVLKSKEEIIKEHIPNGIVNIKGQGDGKPQYKAEIKAIENCMDEYARQEAIGFAFWIGDNGWKTMVEKNHWYKTNRMDEEEENSIDEKTTEELYNAYNLFIESESKK